MKWKRLSAIFTRDFKNKFIALFFAVIVWYFAWNNQIRVSDRRPVLLNLKIAPTSVTGSQWQIVEVWTARQGDPKVSFNNYLQLSLTGPQRDLQEVNWDQVKGTVVVDPNDWQENKGYRIGQVKITAQDFRLPNRSLSVVDGSISPNVIHFHLSRVTTRSEPVEVRPDRFSVTPVSPYRLSTKQPWEVDPERMFIRGPEAYFGDCRIVAVLRDRDLQNIIPEPEKLTYAVTVPVALEHPFENTHALRLVSENGEFLNEQKVRVTFHFEEKPTEQFGPVRVPLWAKTPFSGTEESAVAVHWEPSELWVGFSGIPEDLADIQKNQSKQGFGLHFVVDGTTEAGVSHSVSLPDLKWDHDLIPGRVKLESVDEAGKKTEVIYYKLLKPEKPK